MSQYKKGYAFTEDVCHMKIEKKCPIYGEGKKKRSCKLNQHELICVDCCMQKQSYYCDGCSFYQDNILRFKCLSCGKTLVDDIPSDITRLMGAEIFRLEKLEGDNLENGFAVSGELYTTTLEVPFEGKPNTSIWFYYDPEDSFDTFQLIQGEILEVHHFDEYKAEVEVFVHQTSTCENIPNIFPEQEMPESLYDVDSLFPFDPLKIRTYGANILVSSLTQDGGNWAVVNDDEIQPRIILYAEGFFSHWRQYTGNIRIKKSFLQQLLDDSKG